MMGSKESGTSSPAAYKETRKDAPYSAGRGRGRVGHYDFVGCSQSELTFSTNSSSSTRLENRLFKK